MRSPTSTNGAERSAKRCAKSCARRMTSTCVMSSRRNGEGTEICCSARVAGGDHCNRSARRAPASASETSPGVSARTKAARNAFRPATQPSRQCRASARPRRPAQIHSAVHLAARPGAVAAIMRGSFKVGPRKNSSAQLSSAPASRNTFIAASRRCQLSGASPILPASARRRLIACAKVGCGLRHQSKPL